MGADAPMLRSRLHGGHCRVPGHGSWCEVSDDRRTRERRDERPECTCGDDPWGSICALHDALKTVRLVPVDESEDVW